MVRKTYDLCRDLERGESFLECVLFGNEFARKVDEGSLNGEIARKLARTHTEVWPEQRGNSG